MTSISLFSRDGRNTKKISKKFEKNFEICIDKFKYF